jgi:hypothetical protein
MSDITLPQNIVKSRRVVAHELCATREIPIYESRLESFNFVAVVAID